MSEPAHWEEYIIRQFTRTKLQATDMRCFRKLLGISYRDHITNDTVRDRISQAIGPYDDILTTVKKRNLKWFGHVSRSSGLANTISQETVQGERRRGRQKKRWENNIAEWIGFKFCEAVGEAENKIKWRERDATSVAPHATVIDYGIGAGAVHTKTIQTLRSSLVGAGRSSSSILPSGLKRSSKSSLKVDARATHFWK